MTTSTKILSDQEIKNILTLKNFHEALEQDFVSMSALESKCCTDFRLGTSPLTTIRKYFSKYGLEIEVVHRLINNSTQKLNPKKVRFNKRYPTLIILNYENNGITRMVDILYHAGCKVSQSKYCGIKFWQY
jgi:hypothetical protein